MPGAELPPICRSGAWRPGGRRTSTAPGPSRSRRAQLPVPTSSWWSCPASTADASGLLAPLDVGGFDHQPARSWIRSTSSSPSNTFTGHPSGGTSVRSPTRSSTSSARSTSSLGSSRSTSCCEGGRPCARPRARLPGERHMLRREARPRSVSGRAPARYLNLNAAVWSVESASSRCSVRQSPA